MTDTNCVDIFRCAFFEKLFVNILLRRFYGIIKFSTSDYTHIKKIYRIQNVLFYIDICFFVGIEIFRNFKRNFKAVIKLSCFLVVNDKPCVKVKPTVAVHTRVRIYVKLIALLGIIKKNLPMIHIKPLNKSAVKVNYKLRIYCVPALIVGVG